MKRGFAFATIVALVIAASVMAFVPSVRAQVMGWFRARWEFPGLGIEIVGTQPGYTVLVPSYLPDTLGSGNQTVGMASIGDDAMSVLYRALDGQWMQVTQGPAPADKALPAGQEVTIGGQKGVLITGLSGTLELGPALPKNVQEAPPTESFAYQNARRLVWYVGNTRVEILSSLPVEEMLKVAESFRPAETGEGKPPMPELPPGRGGRIQGLAAGTLAPSFSLVDANGRTVSLQEFAGKPVLLAFSATDCVHCQKMYSVLKDFHKAHPDLVVLMISRGSEEENRRLVQEEGFTFPVLAWQDDVAKAYQVTGVPFFYLIDGQGVVASFIKGAVTPEQLEAWVKAGQ